MVKNILAAGLLPDFPLPDDLTERDQWLLWRHEGRNGRTTKVPLSARGRRIDITNPREWLPYSVALAALRKSSGSYAGLGFAFSEKDPFVGVDLDYSLDGQGGVKAWARGVVERFCDTYMETSPSGLGLKIWARGTLPANLPGVKVADGSIELYDHARYFTVTGQVFRGAPLQIEDHATDLLALHNRLTGAHKKWPLQPSPGGQIPYGQQHNTLISLCGTLRARRVCEEAIESCLQAVNERQCEKPGSREHIARIVRSSRRWGTDGRRSR